MKPAESMHFHPVASLAGFDAHSGNALERLLFNYRKAVILVCALITAALGYQLAGLRLNASFADAIPTHHPFIQNYLANETELKGLSNVVRVIVVKRGEGDIFDPEYLTALQGLNDEVYNLPGVDRSFVRSLWMPAVRWLATTDEGYEGGPVMPDDYDGSPASLHALRENVMRSGEVGQLVAPDLKSSVIYVPMMEVSPETGERLDYGQLSRRLEELRAKYGDRGVDVRIIGFAKVMGDLIEGLYAILGFFALSVAVTAAILLHFTRCLRSTALVIGCTLVAVVWLLGLLPLIGFQLNPYSILIPFLIFAIGVSHGAQKMNGIMQDIGRGAHKLVAARYTFRRLFLAGATALIADAVGFAVLKLIDIPVIGNLATIASIGVGILIFTNLALLPVLLSYTGVSAAAAARSLKEESAGRDTGPQKAVLWRWLDYFTGRKYASIALAVALAIGAGAYGASLKLQIGDLDSGAPELRPGSRYNLDNAYLTAHYHAGTDVLAVMVKTPTGQCANYDTLMKVDALEWSLRQLDAVETTSSLAGLTRRAAAGMNEGNLKWYDLVSNQGLINGSTARAPRELFNDTCDLLTVQVFLKDHKAETLKRVVDRVEAFAAENDTEGARFLLAAGNAGIEAATNEVVKESNARMLLGVYAAVIILCAIAFRSWQAIVCAVLPLALTSVLAEALMVALGIGVKVATLPVIALGVGIGVDYALYIMSVTLTLLRQGDSLSRAYYGALAFTGRVVVFTGLTLSVGVASWMFSPIKFQADMGVLLAFMLIANMIGALILIPAIAAFLFPRPVRPI